MRSITVERVRQVAAAQFRLPGDSITADTDVLRICDEESLAVAESIIALEEEFALSLPHRPEGLRTVRDFAHLVEAACDAAGPPGVT